MKKSCKVLCLMLIVFMMSGCVKANIDMSINKDKSMKLSVTSAVDQSLLQQYGSEGLMDEETKNEAENNGFKVDEYSDGSMKGYTLSKEFKNIDDISSDKKVNFDLEKLMNEENAQIFTVKQGFFKNTYTVTMENNTSSELESQMDFGDSTNSLDYTNDLDYNDAQGTIDENYTQDSTTDGQDNSMDFSSNIDLSSISSNMDMKFNVTLPYKAIKSNATSTENDGKKLVWDLMNQNLQNIEFQFELYNMNNVYLTAGIVGAIIIIIVIVIISKKRKPKTPVGTPVKVTDTNIENINQNIAPTVSATNGQPIPTVSNGADTKVEQAPQVNPQIQNNMTKLEQAQTIQTPNIVSNQPNANIVEPIPTVSSVTETKVEQAPQVNPQIQNNMTKLEQAPTNTANANIFNSTPNNENK